MAEVSKNMKKIRSAAGMTQQELADRLHVTRQAVSSWETGKNHPDLEMLERIAQILEVDLEELIYGKKKEVRQRNGKKLMIRASAFCVVFIILLVLNLWLGPLFAELSRTRYEIMPSMILITVLRPAMYVSAAAAGMSVFSVFYDIRISGKRPRWILGMIGIVIILIFELGFLNYWTIYDNVWDQITYVFMNITTKAPAHYILPGVLLFLAGTKE